MIDDDSFMFGLRFSHCIGAPVLCRYRRLLNSDGQADEVFSNSIA
jgi:hypothetical protein